MMDKMDNDAFAAAHKDQMVREQIAQYTRQAISYGHVNRDWANSWLAKLGAAVITGTAEYRMNVPITGAYGWRCKATSRAEALEVFQRQVARVASAGKITADGSYDNVYELAIVGGPVFYSGPEDVPATAEPLAGDELRAAIRDMLKEGVSQRNWGHRYANEALDDMGIDQLPALSVRTVEVPVSGIHRVTVTVFEGEGDDAVQQAVTAKVGSAKNINITADEVGTAKAVEGSVLY